MLLFSIVDKPLSMTNPTRTILTPEVIFTSDELDSSATLAKPATSKAKRKFSFPVGLHSSLLLSSETNAIGRTTRRLSNVSDRVSDRVRKLSTAMGWHQSPSKDILISQGKFLITLYIRFRLKRCGVLNQQKKKLGLQKMQRGLLIGADVKDVFTALKEVNQFYNNFDCINHFNLFKGGHCFGIDAHENLYKCVASTFEVNNLFNLLETALTNKGRKYFKHTQLSRKS